MRLAKYFPALLFIGCVSNEPEAIQPPLVSTEWRLEDLVDAGIDHGGGTLAKVKEIIERKNELRQAGLSAELKLISHYKDWNSAQLMNATHLFLASKPDNGVRIFELLATSDRPLARRLAWLVASKVTSPEVKKAIDDVISDLIQKDKLNEGFFIPEVADAIAANELVALYPTLRMGLLIAQEPAYARAMVRLNGKESAGDFMNYLSLAPVEELRQLSMGSMNEATMLVVLEYLNKVTLLPEHPALNHLYYISISRNNAISAAGIALLGRYFESNKNLMALRLNSLPEWAQIAFIDRAKRDITPAIAQFLKKFRNVASQDAVVEELKELRL